MIRLLYMGDDASLSCLDAADANADRYVNVSDIVFLLRYLFEGASAPSAPFPSCGIAVDGTGCGCHAACR